MRLNYDCVRDVLLYISEHQTYKTNHLGKKELTPVMAQAIESNENLQNKYIVDDISYSIVQLFSCRYISGNRIPSSGAVIEYGKIEDITPQGHEFLDNVKSESVWEHVKSISTKAGIGTLKTLCACAKEYGMYLLTNPQTLS